MLIDKDIQILPTACKIIRKQANNLTAHFADLEQTDDVEPLHQIRVASRRLREALIFFADYFDPTHVDTWKKAIKKLLRKLSTPRDLDVQIAFLNQFISELGSEPRQARAGIERLLLRLKQYREKQQKPIAAAVKQFQKKHILINICLQMEKAMYMAETYPLPDTRERWPDLLRRYISPRLEEVQTRLSSLDEPHDVEGQHQLRIAIKKLRYTAEISDTLLAGSLTRYLESLKEAQTLLGNLHDCDVWLEMIDQFEDEEKQRMLDFAGHTRGYRRLRPGLAYFKKDRLEQRQKWYQQAVAIKEQWHQHHLLQQLSETIEQANKE